ncbi:MAG TPA: hypothetical protein VEJ63_21435, partial [Planctomycetota bacterium]|nr:hypothetical protein [Planctomycetota bacterium]
MGTTVIAHGAEILIFYAAYGVLAIVIAAVWAVSFLLIAFFPWTLTGVLARKTFGPEPGAGVGALRVILTLAVPVVAFHYLLQLVLSMGMSGVFISGYIGAGLLGLGLVSGGLSAATRWRYPPPVPVEPPLVPASQFQEQRTSDLLLRGATTVLGSVVKLALLGGIGAGLAYSLLFAVGWMPFSNPLILVLVFIVYVAVGAIVMGYAGFSRGLGLTVRTCCIETGMATYALEKMLDGILAGIEKSERASELVKRGEIMARDLPLQQWETLLKDSIANLLRQSKDEASASGIRGRLAGAIKRFLYRRIEKYLLAIVRAETTAS